MIITIWKHIHNAWTLHNDAVHVIDGKLEDADLKERTHFQIIPSINANPKAWRSTGTTFLTMLTPLYSPRHSVSSAIG
jgi:hypothetical protein